MLPILEAIEQIPMPIPRTTVGNVSTAETYSTEKAPVTPNLATMARATDNTLKSMERTVEKIKKGSVSFQDGILLYYLVQMLCRFFSVLRKCALIKQDSQFSKQPSGVSSEHTVNYSKRDYSKWLPLQLFRGQNLPEVCFVCSPVIKKL